MIIKNNGAPSAKEDLQEIVDALQDKRADAIGQLQQMVLASRALLDLESRRLKAKLGGGAERVQQLTARVDQQYRVAKYLGVEEEVASIRTPMIDTKDTLVQGRLLDNQQYAVAGAEVWLAGADGKAISGVESVKTDAAGYYAFVMSPETAAKVAATGEARVALGDQGKITLAEGVQPFKVLPGARTTLQAQLDTTILHSMNASLKLNTATASAMAARLKAAVKAGETPPK